MKKVIRLTESDLYNIVKKVLKEQTLDYDYYFERNTGVTDLSDTYQRIYLKKDGDTYLVFGDNGGVIKGLGIKLPKEGGLGLIVNNESIKYNAAVGDAVSIASLIIPGLDSFNKAKKGIFVGENGIPVMAQIGKSTYPLDILEKDGGQEHKVKEGETALKNDYFVVGKNQSGFKQGVTINIGYPEPAKTV
jgi:hypothetical protein